jgi:hypothetical protein
MYISLKNEKYEKRTIENTKLRKISIIRALKI